MPRKAKHPSVDYKPLVPPADKKYLGVRETAAYLGCAVSFVRHQLVYAKAVPFVRLGARILFDRFDLDAYMAARKQAA